MRGPYYLDSSLLRHAAAEDGEWAVGDLVHSTQHIA